MRSRTRTGWKQGSLAADRRRPRARYRQSRPSSVWLSICRALGVGAGLDGRDDLSVMNPHVIMSACEVRDGARP